MILEALWNLIVQYSNGVVEALGVYSKTELNNFNCI